MNALLFERPVWFATGPLVLEEEPQQMEDFTYHRPVLAAEVVELLAPHPGSLVVDGTVGGGGHAEAILKTGADVLAHEIGHALGLRHNFAKGPASTVMNYFSFEQAVRIGREVILSGDSALDYDRQVIRYVYLGEALDGRRDGA